MEWTDDVQCYKSTLNILYKTLDERGIIEALHRDALVGEVVAYLYPPEVVKMKRTRSKM